MMDMNDSFLRCKTYGHSWDEYRPTGATRAANLTLRCTRCGMIRYDHIDVHTGELVQRSYDRPAGYRGAKVRRSDLRVELLRRLKRQR